MGGAQSRETEVLGPELTLRHFDMLRAIGRGAFSKVEAVRRKGNGRLYALKCIDKDECVRQRMAEHIIYERQLLEDLKHPFIVNLRFSFQDPVYLFMGLDLMMGGDLHYHVIQKGALNPDHVRFYAAEIMLALAYLHDQNVVHRDVKPDNILLDAQGHAHLSDFNMAVKIAPSSGGVTGISGTLHYMAPEVLRNQRYDASVDWWSLGVVVFQLLTAKQPYRGKDTKSMVKEIESVDIEAMLQTKGLPDVHVAFALQLLHVDPARRLGSGSSGGSGASSPRGRASSSNLPAPIASASNPLLRHPVFVGVDWALLSEKKAAPPFTPDMQELNFNPAYELEDLLLDNSPLRAHQEYGPRPGLRPNPGMDAAFAAFEYYDEEDPHSVAVNELARSMPSEEARIFREKMLRMHRADAAMRGKLTLLPPRPLMRAAGGGRAMSAESAEAAGLGASGVHDAPRPRGRDRADSVERIRAASIAVVRQHGSGNQSRSSESLAVLSEEPSAPRLARAAWKSAENIAGELPV